MSNKMALFAVVGLCLVALALGSGKFILIFTNSYTLVTSLVPEPEHH